jgi:hypothetical protein
MPMNAEIASCYSKQTTPTMKVSAKPKNEMVARSEPPGMDPYAGWWGSRELITPGYPIRPYGIHDKNSFE